MEILNKMHLIDNKMCLVIATYHDDNNGKDYIIYTDETKDLNGKLMVYYGYYHIENEKIFVSDIENPDEEKIILAILNEIKKQ